MTHTNVSVKKFEISLVVTRADGTKEDLGVVTKYKAPAKKEDK